MEGTNVHTYSASVRTDIKDILLYCPFMVSLLSSTKSFKLRCEGLLGTVFPT